MGANDLNKSTEFLRGGGETGAILRAYDWSRTSLGPPEDWPQSLKISVQIILNSLYPMFVWWGPDLINFYNDAYRPFLGQRHPRALGIPAKESWREIWDVVGPQAAIVMTEGKAIFHEEMLLVMERHGYTEETYFTWSYSPISDDSGFPGGVFCACTEETARVISQRRVRTLRALASQTVFARTPEEACVLAVGAMKDNQHDLPFALIYLVDPGENKARLEGSFGCNETKTLCPKEIDLGASSAWPLNRVAATGQMEIVTEISQRFGEVKNQPWPEPVDTAVVLPFARQGSSAPAGYVIAGVSPRLILDDDYRGFLGLLTNQVAASIANADAYQHERRRAEALAEIDRAKTAFFSNVSHEFRTPLTLLLGPLEETLARGNDGLTAKDREQLTVMHRNGLRLLKLVNTLLDFSRLEAGRVRASYEATDLSDFTANLASVFRSAMEKAGLRYRVDCPPLSQPAYVDREMWEKIVLNLLSNAFKFTFTGEVRVALHEAAGTIELIVSDTGTGIPAEELPRVFERFHRVDGASGRTHEGTGIGLALVQELIKLHGGSVSVESSFGQGTRFTVTLPQGRAHLPAEHIVSARNHVEPDTLSATYVEEAMSWLPHTAAENAEQPTSAPAGMGPGREHLPTIVLADDNQDMRNYVGRLLSDHYRVLAVSNGSEAVNAARKHRPDLVLADVMMPVLDGFGVLQAVREDPTLTDIPVILLSARAGEEASLEGLRAGADDYLVKPFTARELLARVGTHVSMSRLRRQNSLIERELRSAAERERERLRAALNASSTATFYWNPEAAEVMHYDPEVLPLFGFSPDAGTLTTADFLGRIHPEDHDVVQHKIEECRQGKDVDFEFRVSLPDGSVRWIHDRGRVVFEDDRPAYVIGAVTDITERKLAHEALIQTEKLASVGRLAATVAHEINNPLESITNLIYLARIDQSLSLNVKNYLRMAEEELGRVAQLTKQTLGFYRESTEVAPTRIGGILRQLVSVFSPRASNKRIKMELELEFDPEIVAVPSELRQLFANMLSNAIDAVPHAGSIRVRVTAGHISETGDEAVRISLRDSGPGIPPALRKRIFEPFFTTKQEVGTGLGLWVCKTIVEKHHGALHVRSSTRPGQSWTVFSVLLPTGVTAASRMAPVTMRTAS